MKLTLVQFLLIREIFLQWVRGKTKYKKEIGMVFREALFDSKTIEENLIVPLNVFSSMSTEQMKDRVNFCLKRVNLDNVNSLYPADLSGGMQKELQLLELLFWNQNIYFVMNQTQD